MHWYCLDPIILQLLDRVLFFFHIKATTVYVQNLDPNASYHPRDSYVNICTLFSRRCEFGLLVWFWWILVLSLHSSQAHLVLFCKPTGIKLKQWEWFDDAIHVVEFSVHILHVFFFFFFSRPSEESLAFWLYMFHGIFTQSNFFKIIYQICL